MTALLLALALGASPRAALEFTTSPGAETCVRAELEDAIATRLGYRPFAPGEPLLVRLDISGRATLTAKVVVTRNGAPAGERQLSGPPDCRQLTEALALALAVVIDPLLLTRAPRAVEQPVAQPEPVTPPPALSPPPQRVVTVAVQPRPEPVAPEPASNGFVWAAVALDLGLTPASPALAVSVGGQLRLGAFAVSLAPIIDLPSTWAVGPTGRVRTWLLAAEGRACWSWRGLALCGAVRGGALRFEASGLANAAEGWSPQVLAGPQVGVRLPFNAESRVGARLDIGLEVALARSVMMVSSDVVWRQPVVALSLALGADLRVW